MPVSQRRLDASANFAQASAQNERSLGLHTSDEIICMVVCCRVSFARIIRKYCWEINNSAGC